MAGVTSKLRLPAELARCGDGDVAELAQARRCISERPAHLPDYLRFAEHYRFEPSGDRAKMNERLAPFEYRLRAAIATRPACRPKSVRLNPLTARHHRRVGMSVPRAKINRSHLVGRQ